MKKITSFNLLSSARRFMLALAVILSGMYLSLKTFAQNVPEKVDIDINAGGDAVWYGQPWVWAVGIAIFIVIIVAITRNNRTNA